ncbi:hypothetical protein [uncultured Parasphingorhabdus sp.]|uniref:hypothetical protein n=1 Tax=uncultured Parasphingorhabdus sp. TaxID=2709694 RepID=UPI002AA69A62|nr:hypothetical protein [uncultured Parasphingorhabdus sp.]
MQTIVEIIDEINAGTEKSDELIPALTTEVLLLAEQLCVERDRFDVAIRLAENGANVTGRSVAEYVFTDSDLDQRLAVHTAFYEQIFNRLSAAINVDQAE